MPSGRNTTPANPGGNRRTAGRGSGRRAASVKSQSGRHVAVAFSPRRDLTARAQDTSLASMTSSPDSTETDIAATLTVVRDRIAEAALRAGRQAHDITLVAVSKTHPSEAVIAALLAGQTVFGENRVQEAASKFPSIRALYPGLQLRLIGGLQTNKVREAVRVADVIESLDRPRLADALSSAMTLESRQVELLVQVNTGDEPQKGGIPRRDAAPFIQDCKDRFGPLMRGVMCIPPAHEDPAPHFAYLAELAAAQNLGIISMGMSGDFEAAIAFGATHVRVGSAIFGSRTRIEAAVR